MKWLCQFKTLDGLTATEVREFADPGPNLFFERIVRKEFKVTAMNMETPIELEPYTKRRYRLDVCHFGECKAIYQEIHY